MQARQHHGEPVAVVMAAVFAVFAPRALEYAVALQVACVVGIAHAAGVFFAAFGEFVGINKGIAAGVVGRVDVNHLHAAGVGFLQDFQGFEVFGSINTFCVLSKSVDSSLQGTSVREVGLCRLR